MNIQGIVLIAIGATCGAICRWCLSSWLNSEKLPWGTLLANVIGGYLIGVVMAALMRWPHVSPELRLAVVTGFLGALTTFSSFSAEVVTFLTSRDYRTGVALVLMHVLGSLVATMLGIWSFRLCLD